MSGFSRFYPDFTAGQLRYLAGGANSALNDQYVICDGSTVSQATYPQLYAQVGLIRNGNWTSTWTTRTTPSTAGLSAVIYNGTDLFVAGGTSGALATSTDAITWTARTSGTALGINALVYNGTNLYVYAGDSGALATSTDAITWTARTSGTGSSIQALAFGGGIYLYGALGGALRTSSDGITWTVRASGTTSAIRALLYASNLYVYAGDNSALATSTDGITWTARSAGFGLDEINALTYANGLYIAGGTNGKLATSTDAITWVQRTTGLPATSAGDIQGLRYEAGYYILLSGQYFGYSTDAITWTVNIAGNNFTSLTYGNNTFVGSRAATQGIATGGLYTYDPTTQFALPTGAVAPSIKYPVTPVVYIKYR
jgi:hypothetical protein